MNGKAYIIGTGPGDEELLTVKAVKILEKCTAVLYDRLVSNNILNYLNEDCLVYYCGKEPGAHYKTQEEINNKNNVKSSRNSIKNYKWDFYATGKDGVKRQQGSLATSVSFTRRSSNTTIGNVKGSVWDIDSSSQLLSRSNGFLENHITRLDVNQPNQTLYSWGPYDSGKSTATVSLTGLLDVKSWSFPLNGFSVTDLSNKGSKYGRWQYKAHLTSSPTTMNTRPGMRVTNTKGSLITKLSQTAKIATPYAISDHSTGVISIYTTDR